jgi:hypothetical protein
MNVAIIKREDQMAEKRANSLNAETILKYESEYVLHPWVAQKG